MDTRQQRRFDTSGYGGHVQLGVRPPTQASTDEACERLAIVVGPRTVGHCDGRVGADERAVTRGRPANFRIQAKAGGLCSALVEGEASPAAPDPER